VPERSSSIALPASSVSGYRPRSAPDTRGFRLDTPHRGRVPRTFADVVDANRAVASGYGTDVDVVVLERVAVEARESRGRCAQDLHRTLLPGVKPGEVESLRCGAGDSSSSPGVSGMEGHGVTECDIASTSVGPRQDFPPPLLASPVGTARSELGTRRISLRFLS
jgi:hypothetical protein